MIALNLFLRKKSAKISEILQTENAECGLACLGMICSFYKFFTDLSTLRSRFPISQKGCTIQHIMEIAHSLDFTSRPLKLDLNGIPHLKLPCILHWEFNHFVVLESVQKTTVTIIDPSFGRRTISLVDLSKSFTGIALELLPTRQFEQKSEKRTIKMSQLFGQLVDVKKSVIQIIVLAVALEIFGILNPLYVQLVLDKVIVSDSKELLNVLVIGFICILIFHRCVEWMRSWMLMYLGTIVNIQWRSNVLHHLLHLPVSYFEKRTLGDVVSRFNSIDVIQKTLTVSFIESVLDGVMVIITLAIMLVYSPSLSLVSIGAMLLYIAGRLVTYLPLKSATEEKIVYDAKSQTNFLETVRGVKAIKLYSCQENRHALSTNLMIDNTNAGVEVQRIRLNYSTLNSLIFGIERILVFYFGAKLVISGDFTIGVLMAFNIYREKFGSRMTALVDRYFEFSMLRIQGERLADIVLENKEPNFLSSIATHQISTSIRFDGISFRHADGEPLILNDLSFAVAEGESVALIGPSGCGKTTIVNLILGILKPVSGQIFIGESDVAEIGFNNVRKLVGTVMQDDTLFSGSIADNICFFDNERDQMFIVECAKLAWINDDINAMPMGYNTLIGDMGAALSGGQKQRILIARALYKKPKILLLDEATSHLDVDLEQKVNASIKSLNMTRVIVAHRLETIASADRIVDISRLDITASVKSLAPAADPICLPG